MRRLRRLATRLRVPRHEREAGLSIAELIVSMALFSVVSMLIVVLFTTFARSFTRDRSATDNTNGASLAMNEVSRVVRAGTEINRSGNQDNLSVFTAVRGDALTMHAFLDTDSLNPKPVKIEFVVVNHTLVEKRYPATNTGPYWTFATSPSSTKTIARTITPGTESGIFTFIQADGVTPVTLPVTGSLTDNTALRTIAMISVDLSIQADITDRAEPVQLTNTVGIPNRNIAAVEVTP